MQWRSKAFPVSDCHTSMRRCGDDFSFMDRNERCALLQVLLLGFLSSQVQDPQDGPNVHNCVCES